ncbi:MAG TPA: hypothetical protein VML55_25680 [Planctomycetaceae bacterium]|nr:hypothetical protein [Planctomycetaceae bacterium]
MPIEVRCPSCETKLRVKDELAGRVAACPRCKQRLRIPGSSSTTPDAAAAVRAANDLDRRGPAFGETFSPDPLRTEAVAGSVAGAEWSWETLRTGLRIVHGGAITGLCGTGVLGLGIVGLQLSVASLGGGRGGGAGGLLFWSMLLSAGTLAAYSQLVVMLTGWACCRAAPAEIPEATRTWTTLAVAASGSGIAVAFGMFVLPQIGGLEAAGTLIKLVMFASIAAILAGYACFGGFLRGVGEHFGDAGLRTQSIYFMLYVAVVGAWTLLHLFVFGGDSRVPGGGPFAGSGLVMLLVHVGLYVVLFLWLRDLARKAARQVDFHMRSM